MRNDPRTTNKQAAREQALAALEERLGVTFTDYALLLQAVTHSSYTMEHGMERVSCNERLEFLGDAFFDAIIGEELYHREPDLEEGKLTKLRAMVVCEQSLYEVGKDLGLGDCLFLGNGEERSGGRGRVSLLADAMESVIGAIYLDQGYETVRRIVLCLFDKRLNEAATGRIVSDHKSRFQEEVQRKGPGSIEYRLLKEEGPDHDKTFFVTVLVDGCAVGSGEGKSKKEAEQEAARDALDM